MSHDIPLLSTGQPSTLGSYYDLCCSVFGRDSIPAKFFANRIEEESRDAEVIQPESQVMIAIGAMLKPEAEEEPKPEVYMPRQLAHAMIILAYRASIPMGMGWIHERDNASDEEILRGTPIRAASAGGIEVSADYVLGRMMKLYFKITSSMEILGLDSEPRVDYQSWARKYPTNTDLIAAAREYVAAKSHPATKDT